MDKKTYTLNTVLAIVLGIALFIYVLVRTFLPNFLIPALDVPNMVLISLVALVLDHYVAPGAKRCYICIPVFAAVTFGLLPFAACFVGALEALKLAVVGAVVFTLVTWLYSTIQDRLSSGPAAKLAPIISALGLYLAFQAFTGMIL